MAQDDRSIHVGQEELVEELERLRARIAQLEAERETQHISEHTSAQTLEQTADRTAQAYRLLASQFPNGIVALYDRDLRYTLVEGQGLALSGLTRADLEGKRLRDVFPPEVYERDEPALLAALEGNETLTEVPHGPRTFLVRTAPLRDSSGAIIGGMVVTQDISEFKRAQEKLRERERFIQHVADTVPGLLYVYDHIAQRNVYINREVWRILGYTPEQVQAREEGFIPSVIHPDDLPVVLDHNQRLRSAADGEIVALEYRMQHANGEWRWLHGWETIFARTEDGELWQSLGIALDVTERKLIDAELERYRQGLEERVEQRTAELRAANEHLQVLTQAKDEFVSNVSHELRTPIANLVIRLYLLSRQPDQVGVHLPVLQRETRRLESLIENLLILSRLDQERQPWLPEPLDLNQIVEEYAQDRVSLAADYQLDFTLLKQPGLPRVLGDPNLLGQVLSILLTNAFNYTPVGGNITLALDQQTHAGRQWVGFSVADTGLGIIPDDLPHLFERFFRGQAGQESGMPGTGLGLSIAHEIVELHGGRITVTSTGVPGEGVTFTVWLPVEGDKPDKSDQAY